ncbi:MAG: hypothetical protein NZ839_05375, partial [Endomicrobia bacterium]|nr:hypothetical protein [Endomicrobiia bacterium]
MFIVHRSWFNFMVDSLINSDIVSDCGIESLIFTRYLNRKFFVKEVGIKMKKIWLLMLVIVVFSSK